LEFAVQGQKWKKGVTQKGVEASTDLVWELDTAKDKVKKRAAEREEWRVRAGVHLKKKRAGPDREKIYKKNRRQPGDLKDEAGRKEKMVGRERGWGEAAEKGRERKQVPKLGL